MTEPQKAAAGEAFADDLSFDAVMARFNGDARAALRCALDDIDFLRREIGFARLAMSYGFERGWRPSLERLPGNE